MGGFGCGILIFLNLLDLWYPDGVCIRNLGDTSSLHLQVSLCTFALLLFLSSLLIALHCHWPRHDLIATLSSLSVTVTDTTSFTWVFYCDTLSCKFWIPYHYHETRVYAVDAFLPMCVFVFVTCA